MAPEHLMDGTEITDEVLEELAREAEAGYDLSHARRRYVPRATTEAPPQPPARRGPDSATAARRSRR